MKFSGPMQGDTPEPKHNVHWTSAVDIEHRQAIQRSLYLSFCN